MNNKVYLAGIGALTAAGDNSKMIYQAVKAGLNLYRDSGYVSPNFFPLKMGLVPDAALPGLSDAIEFYGADSRWHQQLLCLAHGAMLEAMQDYTEDAPVPLVLSCPEAYQRWPHRLPADFIQKLSQQADVEFCPDLSRGLHIGRAGGIEAINIAQRMLEHEGTDYVLVGGVDSYQRPELLNGLFEEQRLSCEQVMDGFTPGEGACFLLLCKDPAKALVNGRSRVRLGKAGSGQEPGHWFSDAPYLGEGLMQAVSAALDSYQGPAISRIYSSMNGENYWAKELGVVISRNSSHLAEGYSIEHPAECYGDLGAASSAMLIAIAGLELANYPDNTMAHLILGSSDQAYRGAVTVIKETITQEQSA